jgi:hypothetical protein
MLSYYCFQAPYLWHCTKSEEEEEEEEEDDHQLIS